MASGGLFMHKLYFCHPAHFCSSPKSPNIEGQQHFGQKYPKLFTWEGKLFPFGLGGTANINIWAHPLPSNICIFVFLTINFAFLAAYGLSLALEQFQPVLEISAFSWRFSPRLVKLLLEKEVPGVVGFFYLLGCFLHLISLLSTRFLSALSIKGILSCSCKSEGCGNICWM